MGDPWIYVAQPGEGLGRCPTCGGGGIVQQGSFTYPAGQSFGSTHTPPDECRTCEGSGCIRVTAGNLMEPMRRKPA